jgi:hypothetical protein
MSSLTGFLSAMVNLRNQRLEEALAEEKMQRQDMAALGGGIGDFFGNIGKGLARSRQDAIANQLMNQEDPPRAMAVDPRIEAAVTQDLNENGEFPNPSPHTGGTEEMEMRFAMADMRAKQMRAKAMQERADAMKAQTFIQDAQRTWAQTDRKLQNEYTNSTAYIKEMRVLDEGLAKAEDPMAYQAAADRKLALNKAAIKRGMDVQPIAPQDIPVFMTPEQKAALAAQREAAAAAQDELHRAQSAPMGTWDGIRSALGLSPDSTVLGIPVTFDKERAVKEAQAKFDQEQNALSGMTGAQTPTKAPISQDAPVSKPTTGASGSSSPFPVGHRQYNAATGQTREWDGEKWIYVQ